jgi:hypothetical protein
MKVVGRKGRPKVDVVVTIDRLQRLANELRKGRPFMPKGVWRFRSYDEADAWKLRMLTRHYREKDALDRAFLIQLLEHKQT